MGNPDVGEGGIVTDISKDARAELYKRWAQIFIQYIWKNMLQ